MANPSRIDSNSDATSGWFSLIILGGILVAGIITIIYANHCIRTRRNAEASLTNTNNDFSEQSLLGQRSP